ncbi:hypothetical protein BH23BAC3_BH23BAC3_30720 [soil metagenome]
MLFDLKHYLTGGVLIAFLILLTGLSDYSPKQEDAKPFDWLKLEQAQLAAETDNKIIMVFVEAEWCGICRRMEAEIFPEKEIQKIVQEKYHPVTIDLDSREKVVYNGREMTEREFAREMNVQATPTILFLDANGEVLAHQIGFQPVERFEAVLTFFESDEFGQISFEEYYEKI